MSRRKRPASGRRPPSGRRPSGRPPSGHPAPPARRSAAAGRRATHPGPRLLADVGILVAVVALVTLVAELAGAANLGVSLGIATIAFALVLMYLMLQR